MKSEPELLTTLIELLRQFPGVGRKTATRYAYWLAQQEQLYLSNFANTVETVKSAIQLCEICHNTTEFNQCSICKDPERKNHQICIVELAEDISHLERMNVYRGRYHVLDGVIDPLNGVQAKDLNVDTILSRIHDENVEEIIIATSPTAQGDRTAQYIRALCSPTGIKISILARGLANGTTFQYLDRETVSEAFKNRR